MAKAAAATAATTTSAPAKNAGAPRGPRGIPLDAKLYLGNQKVVDEKTKAESEVPYGAKNNPKREGTKAAERFAMYKNGMTVEAAIKAGMKPRHITKDVAKGYVRHEGGTAAAATAE